MNIQHHGARDYLAAGHSGAEDPETTLPYEEAAPGMTRGSGAFLKHWFSEALWKPSP